MIIGITGCPGSGKSILAKVMSEQEWVLIDADEIGHEIIEDDAVVIKKLTEAFGRDIINADGKISRHIVSKRAFADMEKTRQLNDIFHPVLIDRITSRIHELKLEKNDAVVDCALIFEWGIEYLFDIVVTVQSLKQLRKERLLKRDNRSPDEIEGMFSAQLPESEKVSRADIVFSNNSSPDRIEMYGLMLSELSRYFE